MGIYWPFRGEPDLREWASSVTARGVSLLFLSFLRKGSRWNSEPVSRREAGEGRLEHPGAGWRRGDPSGHRRGAGGGL